jgi:hypothetical protein
MAEHLRHQSMLATPEPGRSGSNPYGRPRISFRASSSDSSPDSEYPPVGVRLADVTGRPVRCVAMRRRADEYQRSVSHVDGPVAKWSLPFRLAGGPFPQVLSSDPYSVRPRSNLELPALRYWLGIVRRRESTSTGVSRVDLGLHRDRPHCWLPSLALPLGAFPLVWPLRHLVAGCCKVVPRPSWIQTLVVLNHSRDDDQPSRSNEQTCGFVIGAVR